MIISEKLLQLNYKNISNILKEYLKNDIFYMLFIFILIFTIKSILIIKNVSGPTIVNDEYIYKLNAESIFLTQKYANAHYPFAYSIVLAPAFFFKNWYEVMIIINAFLSTLIIPASWFLSKNIGIHYPKIATTLVALIPFHAVYPGFLLSENLFVPAFCLSIGLALRGDEANNLEAAIFGIMLGLTHLTKYLFLPAVPVLYIAWLYSSLKPTIPMTGQGNRAKALIPAITYLLVISIWLWYGHNSGFSLKQLFGFSISTVDRLLTSPETTMQDANPTALFMWATAYASFIILAWMPTWGLAGIWLTLDCRLQEMRKPSRKPVIFILTMTFLIAGFSIMAALHSYEAKYNAVQPSKIMGRYLVQFYAPMVIIAAWALESISWENIRFRLKRIYVALGFMTMIFAVAWWILIEGGIWSFPRLFYKNPVNLIDFSIFGMRGYLIAGICAIIVPVIGAYYGKSNPRLLATPLGAFLLWFTIGFTQMMPFVTDGMTVRMVVEAAKSCGHQGKNVLVMSHKVHLPKKTLLGGAQFWGLEETSFTDAEIPCSMNDLNKITQPTILITKNILDLDLDPVNKFSFKNKNYVIYDIDKNNIHKLYKLCQQN